MRKKWQTFETTEHFHLNALNLMSYEYKTQNQCENKRS